MSRSLSLSSNLVVAAPIRQHDVHDALVRCLCSSLDTRLYHQPLLLGLRCEVLAGQGNVGGESAALLVLLCGAGSRRSTMPVKETENQRLEMIKFECALHPE